MPTIRSPSSPTWHSRPLHTNLQLIFKSPRAPPQPPLHPLLSHQATAIPHQWMSHSTVTLFIMLCLHGMSIPLCHCLNPIYLSRFKSNIMTCLKTFFYLSKQNESLIILTPLPLHFFHFFMNLIILYLLIK